MRPIDADKMLDDITAAKERSGMGAIVAGTLRRYVMRQPTLTSPNKWVSVEERLPPLGKNVLLFVYWHEHCGVYMGWSNSYGWTVFCGIESRPDMQVSHWMPLPAPPDCRTTEGRKDT